MEESKKVWVTGSIILILLVAVFLIYFLVISPSRKIEEEPLKVEEIKTTAETEIGEEKVARPEALDISLAESDRRLRELAQNLSLNYGHL